MPGLPGPVKIAGYSLTAQGVIGIVAVVGLVAHYVFGDPDNSVANGLVTASFIAMFFVAVLVSGLTILAGKTWARGLSIVAEIVLGYFAYSLFSSDLPILGLVASAVLIVTVVTFFVPASLEWFVDSAPDGPEQA